MGRRKPRQPVPLYIVSLKHGDPVEHDGIVSTLRDVLDCYVNEGTGLEVLDLWSGESRRIVGPCRAPRPVLIRG